MDTALVDICYRPLRIAWAIHSSEREAFREAVQLSQTLWGGQYNPIILVDREDSPNLINLFRVDVILPLGTSEKASQFAARFPHLINPFFGNNLFSGTNQKDAVANVLDIHNALVHWHGQPEWKELVEQRFRTFGWDEDDPLADIFLIQLGKFPDAKKTGIDYLEILENAISPNFLQQIRIDKMAPIPIETFEHASIGYLSRIGLRRHYSVRNNWDYEGLFVGDARDIEDLCCFWNLRAADIAVRFIDANHTDRYAIVQPEYERHISSRLSHLDDHRKKLAVWARHDALEVARKLFPNRDLITCGISESSWNGLNIKAPMMFFGKESALGVLSAEGSGCPSISFGLRDKPFSGDGWFHTQHLIISLSFIGASKRGDRFTFSPPNLPELNEFYSRTMCFQYDCLRSEPERIGLLISATDSNASLNAVPVQAFAEKLFDISGLNAKLSRSGLITQQLINRLGGVDGARAFKIAGVRRLIKTHGPTASFKKGAALALIGQKDHDHDYLPFKAHSGLFIEARPIAEELTTRHVFEHLVAKGLFRIGVDLVCPSCKLMSWIALDTLQQQNICELCGERFDATRQLVGTEFSYRRSGLLGLERNAQGAIPVTLLLQQLSVNLSSLIRSIYYLPSFDLHPKGEVALPSCETDFLVVVPEGGRSDKPQVIIGECKDAGGLIDATDANNMRQIADALSKHRLDTFILFAKLAPFTVQEIELAKALNEPFLHRVILLTAAELEPYHFYGPEAELPRNFYAGSPDGLAEITHWRYFANASTSPTPSPFAPIVLTPGHADPD